MFRCLLSGLLLLSSLALQAQTNSTRSYNVLSARVLAIDHDWNRTTMAELSPTFALELGVRRQFGRYFSVAVPLKIGLIDVGELNNISIFGLEALAQLHPFGADARVAPYLHVGGGSVVENFDDANHQYPVGGGINFRLGPNSWFNVQGEYRFSDQANRDNVMVGLGYVYRLSSIDTDKDGVVNRDDACPNLPGPAATNGCPDADGDGITDEQDRCPNLAGDANLAGCPDTDGDGTPDNDDNCPNLVGSAELAGCPDGDADGVADPDDACPDLAGPGSPNGCPDADGDGFYDDVDECPTLAGPLAGCPDTDGDGVPDGNDKCPDQAGAAPSGCPDADGDGVPDADDNCPDAAGPYAGCPDTDGDGTPDDRDRCPTQAGPAANAGCPEIKEAVRERLAYAARAVRFETGSAKLREESYVILSEVGGIMRQYPDYHLTISGHTDDVGSDQTNLELSRKRAAACRNFIVATGISADRISSAGYGETRPLADNATAAGRRQNRRVEFVLAVGKE